MKTQQTIEEQLKGIKKLLQKTKYTANFEVSPGIRITSSYKVLSDLDAIRAAKKDAKKHNITLKSIYKNTEGETKKI